MEKKKKYIYNSLKLLKKKYFLVNPKRIYINL